MKRSAGILCPVTSLPSEGGIGCFSKEAYAFVDFLADAKQRVWQVLPLGPTSYGDSPYQAFSTFAGNPYFIDLEGLVEKGLLTKKELTDAQLKSVVVMTEKTVGADDTMSVARYADYALQYENRFRLLRLAFDRAAAYDKKKRERFAEKNAAWLDDYALFMALKDAHGGRAYTTWEEELRDRREEALLSARETYARETEFYRFLQYEFYKEWDALKSYANKKKVKIIGDIPIYVAHDSADVWANPRLFRMKENGEPEAVAGCPPDAFAKTGQLWGNPLYDWEYHKKTGYAWWIARIAHCLALYDVVRIDHFRGFEAYYAIPYGHKTAEMGVWEKGPGLALFKAAEKKLGKLPIIAEDLGFLTKSVKKLLKKSGYPGMKVLQFAFGADDDSEYLPYKYRRNCVVYTGTHDNDTTVSWAESLPPKELRFCARFLGVDDREEKELPREICRALVRTALSSPADLAVIPMQDWLELGKEARINTPSTLGDNWRWRLNGDECTEKLAKRIRKLTKVYGRA